MSLSDVAILEDKLDLLISLLRIAHREPLEATRESVLADAVSKAVLLACKDWIDAGDLKRIAAAKGKVSNQPPSAGSPSCSLLGYCAGPARVPMCATDPVA
jgi:hypothetical protein